MTERARIAFEVYLRLGDRRTLAKVSEDYAQRGERLPLATLKRWSRHLRWKSLVRELQRADAIRALKEIAGGDQTSQVDDLAVVRELKQRVIQAALLNSDRANITPSGRQSALTPCLRDLELLIDLERRLESARPTARDFQNPQLEPPLPSNEYSADRLRQRFGLPPADLVEPTERQESF